MQNGRSPKPEPLEGCGRHHRIIQNSLNGFRICSSSKSKAGPLVLSENGETSLVSKYSESYNV
jgi:hypothetical protein